MNILLLLFLIILDVFSSDQSTSESSSDEILVLFTGVFADFSLLILCDFFLNEVETTQTI